MTRSVPARHRGRVLGARRAAVTAIAVGAVFALVMVVLGAMEVGRIVVVAVDDVAQLAAVATATVSCARAARRDRGRRREWLLLTGGLACWAAGQAVWTVSETVFGREVPFPSWADAGFLGFMSLASIGLFGWLRGGPRATARWRDILDGAVIATSLLAVSWVTTFSAQSFTPDDLLALALSVAYPVGDVVMATLVLLTVSRAAAGERATLALLACGLGGLAVADGAYVYLITAGKYGSGDLLSAGWVTGFLLIAAAARQGPASSSASRAQVRPGEAPSRALVALPYIPLVLAGAVVLDQLLHVPGAASTELGLGVVLVVLVLGRQLLALAENRYLVLALQKAHDDVRHQALHDSLTGLANRALFIDRLEHAVAPLQDAGGHPRASVSVLFCDLDGFKTVNDERGHALGDELIRQVAQRLRASAGPHGTVARLGGDEFAVLLAESSDPLSVAWLLVEAVREPFVLDDGPARVTLSVGVASTSTYRSTPASPAPTASATGTERIEVTPRDVANGLLRDADRAMYAAKSAGKGRACLAELPAGAAPATPRRAMRHLHGGAAHEGRTRSPGTQPVQGLSA